jgi:hypothetical protein
MAGLSQQQPARKTDIHHERITGFHVIDAEFDRTAASAWVGRCPGLGNDIEPAAVSHSAGGARLMRTSRSKSFKSWGETAQALLSQ